MTSDGHLRGAVERDRRAVENRSVTAGRRHAGRQRGARAQRAACTSSSSAGCRARRSSKRVLDESRISPAPSRRHFSRRFSVPPGCAATSGRVPPDTPASTLGFAAQSITQSTRGSSARILVVADIAVKTRSRAARSNGRFVSLPRREGCRCRRARDHRGGPSALRPCGCPRTPATPVISKLHGAIPITPRAARRRRPTRFAGAGALSL